MRFLFVDFRSPTTNSSILEKLEKKGLSPRVFADKIWSHHLMEQTLISSNVCKCGDLDYFNLFSDRCLPAGYSVYILSGFSYSKRTELERLAQYPLEIELFLSKTGSASVFLGICYGHQLLGCAAGLNIIHLDRKNVGAKVINIFEKDAIVLYHHTKALSTVYTTLGQTSMHPVHGENGVDALFVEEPFRSVSFQFHPEYGATSLGQNIYSLRNPEVSIHTDPTKLSESAIYILKETFRHLF